jgi:membrane associated rhomboid family serine protease
MARHPWGRWLFYLFLMLLCMAAAAVYTLAFWMGLAKLLVWLVQRTLRGAWRTVLAVAHGVWFAICGLAWLVCRGWRAARAAWRQRRLAKMPRGVVIDIEGVWLDEDDTQQRAS